jgi:hypothetical protein
MDRGSSERRRPTLLRAAVTVTVSLVCSGLLIAAEPDSNTRRWWSHTQALASDKMEGRDTGSPGYAAAANYVIRQFEAARLLPAGTKGFRQPVPMRSFRLNRSASTFQIVRDGDSKSFAWFRQVTVAVRSGLPQQIQAPLYFVGDTSTLDPAKTRGAVVVMFAAPRIRSSGAPAPVKMPAGSVATLSIDSLAGPEPPIWPVPYAAAVSLADPSIPARPGSAPTQPPTAFRVNPEDAASIFAGSQFTYEALKRSHNAGQKLPNFAIPGRLRVILKIDETLITSDNILAVLPGSDPGLRDEFVVLSAHLDGYGIGEPRHGDRVYNGAFDDAAYVALLIDLAQTLHESSTKLKRSLLFCIVTGEEKGLLGSRYFVAHPTRPKQQLVADLNLDQLRPIFPLKVLTTLALRDSTLSTTVQEVASHFDIRIQEDPEPERNLLRRSDHFSFMQIGVPAVNFVFGYEKGSPEETIYRRWYAERYHSPADDLAQPWDPKAAAKFNRFYADLVKAVADAPQRPQWSPGSGFAVSTQP